MTHKEAIKSMENIVEYWTHRPTEVEAARLAIKALEKVAKYEEFEKQGEIVLYPRHAYFIKGNKVYKGWVQEAVYSVCRKPLYDIRYDDYSLANYRGYLGNTVFLTEAEAEAKLKEVAE